MYFSVITPEDDLLRQAAHELMQGPYTEHKWLWQFFPSEKDQKRDFIYRRHEVDVSGKHEVVKVPRFYVVSPRAPVAFGAAWRVDSREYAPRLQQGQRLSFELRANPVISKKDAAGKSRRHDVVIDAKQKLLIEKGFPPEAKWKAWKEEDKRPSLYEVATPACLGWLDRRAAAAGFRVISAEVDAYQQVKERKTNEQGDIQLSTVDFSGELIVEDPALFQVTLFHGLGHAKAFGCGLLLIKRTQN